jgi:leucyl/phenylalanyl-tRNA--protein transferase
MKPGPRKFELTADVLLRAYSIGVFPMAESRESAELFWVEPQERGVFPLDGLVVSRSLAKTVRSDQFEVVADRDFSSVMRACAERESTWINEEILRLYCDLHDAGYAHSVEVYENGALVGGLYGVSLRSAFFGESMFHRARDASKAALVHLVARLRAGGYRLLDTQFLTEHLASLGAIAVTREDFRHMLAESLRTSADFCAIPAARALPGGEALALALGTEVAKRTRDDGDRRVRT